MAYARLACTRWQLSRLLWPRTARDVRVAPSAGRLIAASDKYSDANPTLPEAQRHEIDSVRKSVTLALEVMRMARTPGFSSPQFAKVGL